MEKIKANLQQIEKNKFETLEMHNEIKTATHDQERRLVEVTLELQVKGDGLSNHFTGQFAVERMLTCSGTNGGIYY